MNSQDGNEHQAVEVRNVRQRELRGQGLGPGLGITRYLLLADGREVPAEVLQVDAVGDGGEPGDGEKQLCVLVQDGDAEDGGAEREKLPEAWPKRCWPKKRHFRSMSSRMT